MLAACNYDALHNCHFSIALELQIILKRQRHDLVNGYLLVAGKMAVAHGKSVPRFRSVGLPQKLDGHLREVAPFGLYFWGGMAG